VRVVFHEAAFGADIARYPGGSRAHEVATSARRTLEAQGAPRSDLLACASLGSDGTQLEGAYKLYLPLRGTAEERPFGMVFLPGFLREEVVLAYLAFGVRHQPRRSHAPSVYALAHRRRHGRWP